MFKQLIKDITTCIDGKTVSWIKLTVVCATLLFFVASVYAFIYKDATINDLVDAFIKIIGIASCSIVGEDLSDKKNGM